MNTFAGSHPFIIVVGTSSCVLDMRFLLMTPGLFQIQNTNRFVVMGQQMGQYFYVLNIQWHFIYIYMAINSAFTGQKAAISHSVSVGSGTGLLPDVLMLISVAERQGRPTFSRNPVIYNGLST